MERAVIGIIRRRQLHPNSSTCPPKERFAGFAGGEHAAALVPAVGLQARQCRRYIILAAETAALQFDFGVRARKRWLITGTAGYLRLAARLFAVLLRTGQPIR